MGLFKKRKNKQAVAEQQVIPDALPAKINSYRYTYDAWKKEFPKRDKLEFEQTNFPDNLFLYLNKVLLGLNKKYQVPNDTRFAFVPIDNQYYDWLDSHDKIDSVKSKAQYCNELTDEQIFERMKANHWDEEYEIVGIPVYAINTKIEEFTKTSYKIEPELKQGLIDFLENVYGKDNVYMPGYILTQNDFFADERDFIQMARLHFQQGVNTRFIKWEEQKYANKLALIYPLVIPFAIRRRYTSAVLELDKLLQDAKWAPILSVSSKGLANYGIESPDFKETPMYQAIKDYFGSQTIIMETIVCSRDIPEINRQILSQLKPNS